MHRYAKNSGLVPGNCDAVQNTIMAGQSLTTAVGGSIEKEQFAA
jgi:hypothetical protein